MGLFQLNPVRPLQWIALFLITFSFILFLAAVASPNYYSNQYSHAGAWQVCFSGQSCRSIDESCNPLVNISGSDCSKFRAFRAFLLIAFFSSLITMIAAWIVAVESPQLSPYFSPINFVVQVFGWFTSLCALIAFSIIADFINNVLNDSSDKGDAFGLLVSAWVFHSIGMIVWTISTVSEVAVATRAYQYDPNATAGGGPGVMKGDYGPSAPAYANSSMSEPTVVVDSDTAGLTRTNPAVTTI